MKVLKPVNPAAGFGSRSLSNIKVILAHGWRYGNLRSAFTPPVRELAADV
ncbi:MAG: hypothetical protein KJ804_00935 [Proteobacteria bacterium]|nr:hypothetical protein [Pseudomonadota bacterium]MBU1056873.1 hypothetical protein [Pseudomonadota bacterium]